MTQTNFNNWNDRYDDTWHRMGYSYMESWQEDRPGWWGLFPPIDIITGVYDLMPVVLTSEVDIFGVGATANLYNIGSENWSSLALNIDIMAITVIACVY